MKQHEFRQITLKIDAQRKSRITACTSPGIFAGDKADSDITEISQVSDVNDLTQNHGMISKSVYRKRTSILNKCITVIKVSDLIDKFPVYETPTFRYSVHNSRN